MVCDIRIRQLEEEERKKKEAERASAIDNLKNKLQTGQAEVVRGQSGQYGIIGWEDYERAGWCESCAFEYMKGDALIESLKMGARTVADSEIKVGH